MKIGITYNLYDVTITSKLDCRSFVVNRENLDYLISILDFRFQLTVKCVSEYALVDRQNVDTLEDVFDSLNYI